MKLPELGAGGGFLSRIVTELSCLDLWYVAIRNAYEWISLFSESHTFQSPVTFPWKGSVIGAEFGLWSLPRASNQWRLNPNGIQKARQAGRGCQVRDIHGMYVVMDGVSRELSEEPPASSLGGWIGGRVDVLGEWMVTKSASHLWSQFPSLQTMNIKNPLHIQKNTSEDQMESWGNKVFNSLQCYLYVNLILCFCYCCCLSVWLFGRWDQGEKNMI